MCQADQDGDSFGDPDFPIESAVGDCASPGLSDDSSDCDDQDAAIYPGASETPDDSRDSDCDGFDGTACPRDSDQDGYGDLSIEVFSADDDCLDLGESESRDDCDDQDATISPWRDRYCRRHDRSRLQRL